MTIIQQMQMQKHQQTQFFSMPSHQKFFSAEHLEDNLNTLNQEEKFTFQSRDQKILLNTLQQNPKEMSYVSCFEEFIKHIPPQFGLEKREKVEENASSLRYSSALRKPSIQKQLSLIQQDSIKKNDFQCVIEFNKKVINTRCSIVQSQLTFDNAQFSFSIQKITKMKVMYQNYQKCVWITYQDTVNRKGVEIKFKITIQNDAKDQLYLLFALIITQKLKTLSVDIDTTRKQDPNTDKFILTGEIYKMGQILCQWSKRKLVLTDRIESFKGEKCTFQMKNIKQLWTRFQLFQNSLIVKLRHGFEKTQLAIPLTNYPVRYCQQNWLFRIYRLLSASA